MFANQSFPKILAKLTSLVDPTPASNPAVSSVVERTVTGCQTDRSDVVGESDW